MSDKASLLPFAILLLITVLGCGRFTRQASNDSTPIPSSGQTSNIFTLDGKEWKSYDLDDMDIRVDLPGAPVDKGPPMSQMPAGTKEVFSSMRLHAYDEKDFASSYTQIIPTAKMNKGIKELADASMGALKKQASDLSYTVDMKSPSNVKYSGTFTKNGKNYELKGCCIFQKANPARIWSVITAYPIDNADGRTASERIIQSATFKGSSEECE